MQKRDKRESAIFLSAQRECVIHQIAVVSSPDALETISLPEFQLCMRTLKRVLDISTTPLPRILVLHVSEAVADEFGVDRNGVIRHNRALSADPPVYYELWLVGKPDISHYVLALLTIVEDYLQLHLSSREREQTIEQVVWAVSAESLDRRHSGTSN